MVRQEGRLGEWVVVWVCMTLYVGRDSFSAGKVAACTEIWGCAVVTCALCWVCQATSGQANVAAKSPWHSHFQLPNRPNPAESRAAANAPSSRSSQAH